jgi:hypothetical protein
MRRVKKLRIKQIQRRRARERIIIIIKTRQKRTQWGK